MSNKITLWIVLILMGLLFLRVLFPHAEVIDIHAFSAAGKNVVAHGLPSVYQEKLTAETQQILLYNEIGVVAKTSIYLPWSYPPTTSLLMAPLAFIPVWLAQLLLGLATIAAALWCARRFTPDDEQRNLVFALMAGPLFLNVAGGQFGGLFAMALALAIASASPFWFVVVALKPHLLAGAALAALSDAALFRRMAIAGLITLAALAAIHVVEPNALPGWQAAFHYSKGYLAQGGYPLGRMLSPYAFYRTLMPYEQAFALHCATAAGIILWVAAITRHLPKAARLVPLAAAGLTVSPYMYDYDMVFLGLAVALTGRRIQINTPLFIVTLLAGVAGILTKAQPLYNATGYFPPQFLLMLGAIVLLARHAAGESVPCTEAQPPQTALRTDPLT
jgi:Glycosyltransferase family 87